MQAIFHSGHGMLAAAKPARSGTVSRSQTMTDCLSMEHAPLVLLTFVVRGGDLGRSESPCTACSNSPQGYFAAYALLSPS
jgi:hypothetical protein